LLRAKAIQ